MTNADDRAPEPAAATDHLAARIPVSAIRLWTWALAASLAAGAIAWAIGEATIVPEVGFHSAKEKIDVPIFVAGTRNAVTSFGALGAAIGLCMGLTGGLIRRSVPRAMAAGATGLLLGTCAGAAISWLILPYYYANFRQNAGAMTYSLLFHGGVWVGVGAAAGLAFGIGMGGWRALLRGLVGGAGAAFLATVIYEVAGAILFPMALTDRPVSATLESRLAARILVTIVITVGLIVSAELIPARKGAKEAGA